MISPQINAIRTDLENHLCENKREREGLQWSVWLILQRWEMHQPKFKS